MSWKKVKLGDILKQYRIEHRVDDKITYKQVSILNDGSVVLRGEKIGKEIGRKRQFKIDTQKYPNTLIFTRQLLLQGSIGIASDDVHNCIVTENMPMFSIDTTRIDKEFLILFLKSKVFKARISEIELSGSAQKSIHEKTFLNLEFFLPPFELQKELVVDLLKFKQSSDTISTELTHQLTLVKKLRQQLLQDAVQGKLLAKAHIKNEFIYPPAKAGGNSTDNLNKNVLSHSNDQKLNSNVSLSYSNDEKLNRNVALAHSYNKLNPNGFSQIETGQELLAKIKAERLNRDVALARPKKEKPLPPIKPEEIPFEIPENWVWCRLGASVILNRGKSKHRPRNDATLFEGGTYPFIQTGDVSRSKTNGYLIESINGYYNDFGLSQSLLQKKGTLCITIAANIAECGFLGFDACAPDSIVCLKAIDQIIEKYCFYYIIQAREDIEKYAPATAQKNINLEILNSLLIPIPPLAEQNRIVQKLEELMQYCNELEASIKQSESQNEKLLQQVLREALRKEPVEA